MSREVRKASFEMAELDGELDSASNQAARPETRVDILNKASDIALHLAVRKSDERVLKGLLSHPSARTDVLERDMARRVEDRPDDIEIRRGNSNTS